MLLGLILGANQLLLAQEGAAMKQTELKKATFGGGCFWCMESPFDHFDGVTSTTAGYTGGTTVNPNYEEVSSGTTGHAEAVQVLYDPQKVSYEELLDAFWKNIDPTTRNQQFADTGTQYRTAIFYHDEEQKQAALASKRALEHSGRFGKTLVTEIVPAGEFYPAEEYHQNFYKKNPDQYKRYRSGSGRDQYLDRVWGKGKGH